MKLNHLLKGVFLELRAEQSYHQKFPVRVIKIEAKWIHLLSFDSGSILKFRIEISKEGTVTMPSFDSFSVLPFAEAVHIAKRRIDETEKRMQWFKGTDKYHELLGFHQNQIENFNLMTEPWEQLENAPARVA